VKGSVLPGARGITGTLAGSADAIGQAAPPPNCVTGAWSAGRLDKLELKF